MQKPGKTPQGPTPTKGDVQQIRDKLARLIEQKPEKAATILSEWIEKPAALFRRKKDPKKAA